MTEAQADQIMDFLYGMLRPPDPMETRRAWKLQLTALDVDIASQAVINGMQVWEHFPSWPLFYGEYRALVRSARDKREVEECPVCHDDRFVVVALRKPKTTDWMEKRGFEAAETLMIDEMAPCPSCNSGADTSFMRNDGTRARALDPALVRRMMDA